MNLFVQLFKSSLIAFSIVAIFSSCQKDITEDLPANTTQNSGTPGNDISSVFSPTDGPGEDLCFDFVYPFIIDMPDGTQQTINSLDDLETVDALYEAWQQQNPGNTSYPMIVYPVEIVPEDGSVQAIDSEEALLDALEECEDFDMGWEDCFLIIYPVTVAYPDGSTVAVNSDEELDQVFNDWFTANPNSTEYPELQLPINMETEYGSFEIQNNSELEELFESCFVNDWDDVDIILEECFTFVFPIKVELPGGTLLTANDYEELDEIFIEWFEDPDTMGFPTIVYPFDVELEDGSTVTVEDQDGFEELLEDCYQEDIFGDCFTFNYPITIVFPDSSTADVHSDDELMDLVDSWYDQNPNEDLVFQFPIEITLEDGTVVTVQSEEELDEILEDCYDCIIPYGTDLVSGKASAVRLMVNRHAEIQTQLKRKVASGISRNR